MAATATGGAGGKAVGRCSTKVGSSDWRNIFCKNLGLGLCFAI